MSDRISLSPEQILGRKLLEIRQTFESNDEYELNLAFSYYVLDDGITFILPRYGDSFFSVEPLPPEAEPIEHPLLTEVCGRRIIDVMWLDKVDLEYDAAILALDNGYFVTDILGVPFGLLPGVVILSSVEFSKWPTRPFWASN